MISVERADPEQASRLTAITISAKRHWDYPEAWMQIWLPLLTITPAYISSHETWVAVLDDQPVGYYSFAEDNEGHWLDNLWVLPDYIGQGIGRVLFKHALERCKACGVYVMKIEADPYAQSFYERMGAHKVSERHTEIYGEQRTLPVMEIDI